MLCHLRNTWTEDRSLDAAFESDEKIDHQEKNQEAPTYWRKGGSAFPGLRPRLRHKFQSMCQENSTPKPNDLVRLSITNARLEMTKRIGEAVNKASMWYYATARD